MKFSDYLTEAGAAFYARKQKEEPKEEGGVDEQKRKMRIRELMMVDGLTKEEAEEKANEEYNKKKEIVRNTTNVTTLSFPSELEYLGIKSKFEAVTMGWSEANEKKNIGLRVITSLSPEKKRNVYFTTPKFNTRNENIAKETIDNITFQVKTIVEKEMSDLNAKLAKLGFKE